MKSSIINMVLCLGLITLVASTGLGYVYTITKGPIEAAKNAKTTEALSIVIESFDNNPSEEMTELEFDGMPIRVYTGKQAGTVSGYAVETMTKAGFSGEIKMMVGFKPNGDIHNIEVLQQNETPGLGSKMTDPGNPLLVSFTGKNPGTMNMTVTKDGGEVDAITASTISSRAYIDAVDRAFRAFQQVALGISEESVDHATTALSGCEYMHLTDSVNIDGCLISAATDADEKIVGYIVQAETSNGYHGTIRLMVGFLPDGTINNISVMQHNETLGFGAVIEEAGNVLLESFKGKKASELKFVLKAYSGTDANSGATSETAATVGDPDGDVDGITGSTITSNAYIEAVKRAYEGFRAFKQLGGE